MKHKKISMKWKVFFYLLGFTVAFLVLLWLMQICYLDTFYKKIKTDEAERAIQESIDIITSDSEKISEEIDYLALKYNLSVLVSDENGEIVYNAEYIPNTKMNMISQDTLAAYFNQAKSSEGSIKLEFEGAHNMEMPMEPMVPQTVQNTMEGHFQQNQRQDFTESVVYIQMVETDTADLMIMISSVLTPVDATVSTLQTQLIWVSIIMLIVSLLIALLISKNITRSIIKINNSAKELAKGDYKVSFSGSDYREIAELSDTLNYATRELGKTESLRRELIANVSHDLRTPLTMIIAYAEVMRDLPGENTPENIQVVIDESRRLTNLVNDMLDISKLQSRVMEKNTSVYNLTESIESVLQRYNKLIEQDGYNITFEHDSQVFVEADEFKIYQVIYNLINNAINYTGEDKKIIVRQLEGNHRVRIEVEDSGIGIRQEELPYVWDRYYKVDKSHKRTVAGTGIGLSIVKNILILHQAEYGVNSQPGQGSTFWFELKVVSP